METGLTSMVVFVTGAANGIGRAVAEGAAEAGAAGLVLTDLDAAALTGVADGLAGKTKVVAQAEDLSDPAAPARLADAARGAFGRIDGLVNAAGRTDRADFRNGTADLFDSLFALNARAPFLLMKEVIGDMLSRDAPGSIVNIQSVNAHCGAPDLALYSATKGALQTLTKNAANAHLADRIRVNGINLGWAWTESEHRMQTEVLGGPLDWAERAGAEMPLGRLLNPQDAARLCVYLLSPFSAPMTGVSLDLDQRVLGAPR